MTSKQGKLIAGAIIVLAIIAVAIAPHFRRPPPVIHVTSPGDLTPGPTQAVFTTAHGTLIFDLYPQLAPHHVAQFLRLVNAGVYTGATVIRIEKDFVIQIDATYARPIPLPPELQAQVEPIAAEFSDTKHHRRTLSMARYDDPDSATASFSVLLGDAPHLDKNYTVFGEMLAESDDTLRQLEAMPVVKGTTKPVEILSIIKAETRPHP